MSLHLKEKLHKIFIELTCLGVICGSPLLGFTGTFILLLRETGNCFRAFGLKFMKRFAFYIAVLFLSFIFSTAVTFIWNDEYWGFAVGSAGMCIDAGGGFSGGGGFRSFVFYDGTKLAFSRMGFDSVEAAQRCYQFELQKATKIIERETLFDEAGEKVVGERVVAIFPPNEYVNNEWARIMSLDGDRIFQITSPSLRHAINFEKRNRKY